MSLANIADTAATASPSPTLAAQATSASSAIAKISDCKRKRKEARKPFIQAYNSLLKEKKKLKSEIDMAFRDRIAAQSEQMHKLEGGKFENMLKFLSQITRGKDVAMINDPCWMEDLTCEDAKDEIPERFKELEWTQEEFTKIRDLVKAIKEGAEEHKATYKASGTQMGYKGEDTTLEIGEDWMSDIELEGRDSNNVMFLDDDEGETWFPRLDDAAAELPRREMEFDYKSSNVSGTVKIYCTVYSGIEGEDEDEEQPGKRQKVEEAE